MKDTPIHQHKRKRYHKKPRQYPHSDPNIRLLDKIVTAVAFLIPLSTLPQVYNVWILKSTAGLSLFTWTMYLIFTFPLLLYVLVHKEKPLVVMYCLWIAIHTSIISGILLFG